MTDIKLTKWTEDGKDKVSNGRITLEIGEYSHRIIQIEKGIDNSIYFKEMCDQAYEVNISKADAVLALQEAIAWIEAS